MPIMNTTSEFQSFFPSQYLKIISIEEEPEQINIKLKSISHNCICNKCRRETMIYHGTYIQKVQDLPILGKSTFLDITAHEYTCTRKQYNGNCDPSVNKTL